MFGFERLDVWRRAIDYVNNLYDISSRFPKEEMYGLQSQLRRAGVSVSANIAEGWGRGSTKDFIHFVEIGYGSLMESVSHLTIAERRSYLPEAGFTASYSEAEELARMLSGFRQGLERRLRTES